LTYPAKKQTQRKKNITQNKVAEVIHITIKADTNLKASTTYNVNITSELSYLFQGKQKAIRRQ